MKLLTKLSLFTIVVVLLTALTTTFFSIATIRGIIYDLNSQLIQNDLENLQSLIEAEHLALKKHGLENVNSYYQKVLARIQQEVRTNHSDHLKNLIILDNKAKKILFTGPDIEHLPWETIKAIYLHSANTQQLKVMEQNDYVYFYKKIPQWQLGLFIVVNNKVLYSRLNEYIDTTLAGLIVIVFLALFAGFLFSKYLVKQIHEILGQITAIKNGNLSARIINIHGQDEISEIKKGLNTMTEIIAEKINNQKRAEIKSLQLSLYDPLTNLPNRRLLMERLEEEIARNSRHDITGAILFIDLDDFKTVNDTCGHRVGDLLLQEAAQRLKRLIRKEDLACRLGGDEFVILLSDLDADTGAASVRAQTTANKILDVFKQPYQIEERQHQISCSIGIVLFPEESRDSHDLIKYADIAMYQAKNSGKNTVKLFSNFMQNILEHRLYLQNELRIAIKNNALSIYLQPQYNAQGQLISAEILVRWKHPELGFIAPAEFIPIAEESGQIHALGKMVMSMALEQLQQFLERGVPESFKRIAINISPWQFGRKDFVDEVKNLMDRYQIPYHFLELEITEQTLVGNFSLFAEKMKLMQKMGISFSIDDFGTGYSSLSYLKLLPVNMLKIDRSFIRDIGIDKNDDAIVRTIIMMAKNLDLEVIAEGVESKQQLEFLLSNDCHLFQGYYFSKPVPVDEFKTLLQDNGK